MKLRDPKLQSWHIVLLLGVITVSLVLGIVQRISRQGETIDNTPPMVLNAQTCQAAGGAWNECGSACRGQENEEACITVCVQYCECTSNQQCPFASECINYVNDVGVCTNMF